MELETFKTIVLPLQEKLLSQAGKLLANSEDTNDSVQETFIRLWNNREQLLSHPNVGGYAMQTLKNICFDKIRQRKTNISLDDIQLGTDNSNPSMEVENQNSIDIIKHIVETLPELQRQIIRMRDIEEYELQEIAEITGSNVSAVKVNLSRARKKVRDKFISIQSLNWTKQ